jgi:hypothetical protein
VFANCPACACAEKALGVSHACASIDATVVNLASLRPDDARVQQVKQSPTGWLLLKHLSLIRGSACMELDSLGNDFLIHLMAAMGFNDGDLVIL